MTRTNPRKSTSRDPITHQIEFPIAHASSDPHALKWGIQALTPDITSSKGDTKEQSNKIILFLKVDLTILTLNIIFLSLSQKRASRTIQQWILHIVVIIFYWENFDLFSRTKSLISNKDISICVRVTIRNRSLKYFNIFIFESTRQKIYRSWSCQFQPYMYAHTNSNPVSMNRTDQKQYINNKTFTSKLQK